MSPLTRLGTILMVDDDAEDCLIAQEALARHASTHQLRTVGDGEELFEYLHRQGKFEGGEGSPRPDLILLDLNMPRKDGREALGQLKTDARWQRIPIVVLTTSTADDDIEYSYRMGASSYIPKPVSFQAWIDLMGTLTKYWFELAKLPQ